MDNLERFFDFEAENHLFDLEYKGIRFWHIIRMDIWYKIVNSDENASIDRQDERSIFTKLAFLKRVFWQKRQEFKKGTFNLLVFCGQTNYLLNGKKQNPYTSFLEEMPEFTAKKLNHCIHNESVPDDEWTTDALRARLLWTKLHNKMSRHRRDERILNLLNKINDAFPNAITDVCRYEYKIRNTAKEFAVTKKYYKRLLKDRFQAVYLIAHYSFWEFALIAAAKELQIPAIEYQHGIIAKNDICYRTNIKSRHHYFPDYLLTYSQYWNQNVQIPSPCICKAVGNPVIDEARKRYSGIKKKPNTVVFYSSYLYGKELSTIAVELAKVLKREFQIIYKLHPNEFEHWQKWYPNLMHSRAHVAGKESDTYKLMAEYANHVSVSSAALFEAAAFQNRIFVFDFPFFAQFSNSLLENPDNKIFQNALELADMLRQKPHQDSPSDPYYYYTNHSFENIRKTLHEILDKH